MTEEVKYSDVRCSQITRITKKSKVFDNYGRKIVPVLCIEIQQDDNVITLEKHNIDTIVRFLDNDSDHSFEEMCAISGEEEK